MKKTIFHVYRERAAAVENTRWSERQKWNPTIPRPGDTMLTKYYKHYGL